MNTAQKTCFRCEAEKPLTEYYKHKGMADGHLNKCKACALSDVKAHREANIDRIREYDRERGYRISKRPINPIKRKARTAVGNAVRDGRLDKPDQCEECDSTFRVEGHHDDYSKPLEVRWLCSVCHKQWHLKNGDENGFSN